MKHLLILGMLLLPMVMLAQEIVPAHIGVVAYDDEDAIERQAYRESPYYQELTGAHKIQRTDSSTVYTWSLDADKVWRDYCVWFNVRCAHGCRVSLNGKELGTGDDARNWNAFLLDSQLKYGKTNTLTVEAIRHTDGAKLEDSTLAVGLDGIPFLLFKTDPNVADFTLNGSYDATSGSGTLTADLLVHSSSGRGRCYVEVEVWNPQGHRLDRMGRWVVFGKNRTELVDLSRTWPTVTPWNAERPALYTAVIRLRNEKMEVEEVVGCRFGFRTVEVRDGVLIVNGRPVTLKGVVASGQWTTNSSLWKAELTAMKRNNINAVRTSRHSPFDDGFYALCDQLGLYVVADANLMPLSTRREVVATEPEYIPLFERRAENLYSALKNHSSVIAWSLGESRDNGVCMTAAFRRMKELERQRPVLMACAESGEATDIVSLLRPDTTGLRQALLKGGDRPVLMLTSVGNNDFVQLEPLWRMVEGRRELQGGFVDVWPMPPAMLADVAHLYSPLAVSLAKITPDEAEFIIYNRNDFAPLGDYELDYVIYTNLRPNIVAGDLIVAAAGGSSDRVSLRLPPLDLAVGEEAFIRFNLTRRHQSPRRIADAGCVVFPIPGNTAPAVSDSGTTVTTPVASGDGNPKFTLTFESHPDWQVRTLDAIERTDEDGTLVRDELLQYYAADGSTMCDMRATTAIYASGDVVVDYSFSAAMRRVGLKPQVRIEAMGDSVSWFGLDREVLLPTAGAGIVGTYSTLRRNMERREARWCAVHSSAAGMMVRVVNRHFCFAVDTAVLVVKPDLDTLIRIHLRPFAGQLPVDIMTTRLPEARSGIAQPPTIAASAVRFTQPMTVTITSPTPGAVRYTLDGSDPTLESPLYTAPLTIQNTTVVKARVFPDGMPPSFCSTRRFNYDHIVATTFSRKPNTPYNVGADTLLFDGIISSISDFAHGWLGFSGDAVTTTVSLAKPIDVDTLVLRYAHSPATWAFAPRNVTVTVATDDGTSTDTLVFPLTFDPTDEAETTPRVAELRLPVQRQGVSTLVITPQTIGRIPAWHRAKGLKPWLMMDEITVIEQ